LILISSAGLWTGALAADHLGPSSGVIATALIRGATGGPAGVASEIGAAGSSVGEGTPTSRRSRREVGPGGGAARTDECRLHRAVGISAASPTSRRRGDPHRPAGVIGGAVRNVLSAISPEGARPHEERGRGTRVPTRTPAEDRRSRPTESAISDETIHSTGLSAACVLAAHLRTEQRSEAYLAEAQRLSHTGSFGWKPSAGEIIWSDETFRIFQYARATAPTVERVLQRVHPEDRARVQETIDRAAQTGKDVDFEHRLLMPDGSVRHVHVVARALSDESGGLEFAGAVMDVTEHQEARAALEGALGEVKKSERQLQ